jgi:ApaG protein
MNSTYEFTVEVEPLYLAEQSDPERGVFVFAYTVTVENTGRVPAQLIARHWIITDANGHVEQVKGLGVVGKQPLLKPGEGFEYTSWTRLTTPRGTMSGSYFCVAEDGERFEAPIPAFSLAVQRGGLH